jgi:5-methylthioribose kinase
MLRLGLNAGNIYPKLAQHMGAFCARTLYNTSLLALSSTQHRSGNAAVVSFADAHHTCNVL